MKHKQELYNLIESIKQDEKRDSGIDLADGDDMADQLRSRGRVEDDQEMAELNDEILTPNSYRFVSLTKKKKIKNASINIRKVNANNMQQTLGARQASIAPNVTLVICSVCSK